MAGRVTRGFLIHAIEVAQAAPTTLPLACQVLARAKADGDRDATSWSGLPSAVRRRRRHRTAPVPPGGGPTPGPARPAQPGGESTAKRSGRTPSPAWGRHA